MEYDAFTGGVAPGGLRSKSDIRILICYMLKSVNAPLSGDDIIKVLQKAHRSPQSNSQTWCLPLHGPQ